MTTRPLDARLAGRFSIGGTLDINRLGFGAMRITGRGIWGPPADPDEALRTLRRLPELHIDFVDTADSYGPDVSEQLIREALHPYGNTVVATKGGNLRDGPDQWRQDGRPEHLRAAALRSRELLGLDRIPLWQLHRIDAKVPRDEQFAAIRSLIDDGIIAHAGLSEVTVEQIEAASRYFPVATVQNLYNLVNRGSEAVLDHCTQHGIGFIPWRPIAGNELAFPGSVLDRIARAHEATPGQIAIAWLLARSPVMLPIPGTGKVRHLEENVAAAAITLAPDEVAALTREGATLAA